MALGLAVTLPVSLEVTVSTMSLLLARSLLFPSLLSGGLTLCSVYLSDTSVYSHIWPPWFGFTMSPYNLAQLPPIAAPTSQDVPGQIPTGGDVVSLLMSSRTRGSCSA